MERMNTVPDKREKTVIFATGNQDKLREIRNILRDYTDKVVSMQAAGVWVDIEENGVTFMDNALIKAKAVAAAAAAAGIEAVVLADDSGLEIDYLHKEPGVFSARYMGEGTSYRIKNKNLLERMNGVPEEQRTARFVCAIAAVLPKGQVLTAQKTMEGYIGYEEKGENGFGYDPIFIVPEYDRTSAELPPELKDEISHRGQALRAIKMELAGYL